MALKHHLISCKVFLEIQRSEGVSSLKSSKRGLLTSLFLKIAVVIYPFFSVVILQSLLSHCQSYQLPSVKLKRLLEMKYLYILIDVY